MEPQQSFFAMGGYAVFVWPAYVIAVAVLVGLLAASLRQLRAARDALLRLEGPGGGAEAGDGAAPAAGNGE